MLTRVVWNGLDRACMGLSEREYLMEVTLEGLVSSLATQNSLAWAIEKWVTTIGGSKIKLGVGLEENNKEKRQHGSEGKSKEVEKSLAIVPFKMEVQYEIGPYEGQIDAQKITK
jgi:hypothetical protein